MDNRNSGNGGGGGGASAGVVVKGANDPPPAGDAEQASPLLRLPTDLLLLLCSFLPRRTRLLSLGPVCRQLRQVSLRSITALPRWRAPKGEALLDRLTGLRSVGLHHPSPATVAVLATRITDLTLCTTPGLASFRLYTNLTALTLRLEAAEGADEARLDDSLPPPPLPALRSLQLVPSPLSSHHGRITCFSTLTSLHLIACMPDVTTLCNAHAPHLHTLNIRPEVSSSQEKRLHAWILSLPSLTELHLRLKDFIPEHWPLLERTTTCLASLALDELQDMPRLAALLESCTKLRMLRFGRVWNGAKVATVFRPIGARLASIGNTLLRLKRNRAAIESVAAACSRLTRLVMLATESHLVGPRTSLPLLRKLRLCHPDVGPDTAHLYEALRVVRTAIEAYPSLVSVELTVQDKFSGFSDGTPLEKDPEAMLLLEEIASLARTVLRSPPLRLRLFRRPHGCDERFERLRRECACWLQLTG